MTLANTKEAPVCQDQGFRTTTTNQEEVVAVTLSHTADSEPVRFVCPDPDEDPTFGYYVADMPAIDIATLTGALEVIRDSGSSTWEVDLIGLNTRSRGLTPEEAFGLSRLIYAAGIQARLLNEGVSPEIAVRAARSILDHPAGTR